MLRKVIFYMSVCCFAATMMVNSAYAHGDGGHGATIKAEEVVDLASRYVTTIVTDKKEIEGKPLAESWLKVAAADKAIDRQGSWYFVVKMLNKSEKQTMYMMISKKGKLYQVNFNGTFEGYED